MRMERVVNFMQMRHYLTLARKYSEADLIDQITQQNRFYVRLTNMVRSMDPTSQAVLQHYRTHQRTDTIDGLADLLLNIMFLRTLSGHQRIPSEIIGIAGPASLRISEGLCRRHRAS